MKVQYVEDKNGKEDSMNDKKDEAKEIVNKMRLFAQKPVEWKEKHFSH